MSLREKLIVRRGANRELLPVETEITIDGTVEKIQVTPLTVGEINTFSKFKDETSQEAIDTLTKILSDHIVDPKLSFEDCKDLKAGYATELFEAIRKVSKLEKKL